MFRFVKRVLDTLKFILLEKEEGSTKLIPPLFVLDICSNCSMGLVICAILEQIRINRFDCKGLFDADAKIMFNHIVSQPFPSIKVTC